MSRVNRKEWYRRVNTTWPAGDLPELTAEEAIRAGAKLYRFALGATFNGRIRITSGRRYSWVYGGVMVVNPGRGWHALVHDLSHYCHNVYQRDNPHSAHGGDHARMEIRMIKEAVKRGWLNGVLKDKPKPDKPAPDPRAVKLSRIQAGIKRWNSKLKRANTALKKLHRQARYYERVMS